MSFGKNNASCSRKDIGKPSRKKPMYPVNDEPSPLSSINHGREVKLAVSPIRTSSTIPGQFQLIDKNGNDTLWEKTSYDSREWDYIREGLVKIYAILKRKGDLSFT